MPRVLARKITEHGGVRALTDIIERITAEFTAEGDTAAAPGELEPYVAALTVPPVLRPESGDVLQETEIALRPTWVRLHPQLPPTLMWGYGGSVPGPTVEVRRGQRVRIAWTNRIPKESEYPVTTVEVPVRAPGTPPNLGPAAQSRAPTPAGSAPERKSSSPVRDL
jgi:o-aminophenol oxidase